MALRLLYSIAILITFIQLVHMQDCPQDVVFIVDRASYIGASSPQNDLSRNWNLIKTFLSSVAGRLNFGALNTQLAIVTSGYSGTLALSLTASASTATNAINNLDYNAGGGGGSNIADAFQVTRNSALSTANGKRSGVPSICLLLVTYPNTGDTTQERNQLTANCRLIVLTASQQDRVQGLGTIFRNYPPNQADFYQSTFDQLSSPEIITQIVNSIIVACPTTPTPPSTSTTTTTTLPPPTGCSGNTPADVIIVMDSSGSIDAPNFEKAKAFVGSVIRGLNIDSGSIHVGLIAYSDTYRRYFFLNTFTTRGQMLAALNNVTYVPGATNTGTALNYVRTVMLTEGNGDRPAVQNIVLLLTDGGSTDRRATSSEAALLRNTGATILLIGTGNWLYDPEMYAIAGYPSSTIRYINDYNNLLAAVTDYVALICQNVRACSSNPCQNGGTCADVVGGAYVCQCTSGNGGQNCEQTCRGKYDIVFAIDAAWCLSFDDFKRELEFYRNVAIGLGDADIRIGALVYSKVANITFNLGDFSANRKLNALKSFSTLFSGGETNISAPIATARDQMYTAAAGDRPDADNILVILTADMSADVNATVRQAMAARNANTKIVVITVGNRYSQAEVEGIASYPVANNIFNIADFSSLTGILNRFTQTLCNNVNECSSNPCQNGGTCTDLLNGYQCACDNTHTGVNCERANSGIMDVVFCIDTSGMSTLVINFIVSVLENLEISGTKTRVGCLIYSSTSTSVFELNTYTSKQDVIWAMKQIAWSGVFSSSTTTNTASALQMLRDVKFTSANGDRSNVQNFALFFTNINSNVNPADSVPNAILTRASSGSIYIICFGIGTFAYLPELVAVSSVAGYPVLLIENSLTIFKANSFTDLPTFLNSYLSAFSGDQSNKCNSNPCMNGGTCLNDVKKFTCQCQADFGGETCSRRCARTYEVAIVLDISGSGDVGHVVDWNINLARQIVLGLPIRPGRVSLGVITFGSGSSVSFYLNSYNSKDDILNALSFRLATGPNGLQTAFQTLTADFFTAAHGSSGSAPKVALLISSSDTPPDYSGIVQAAAAARNANIEIFAIALGNGPNMAMINAIASNSTANHVYSGSQTSDIATIAGNFLTFLCQ